LTFLQNIGKFLSDKMASNSRRRKSS